MSSCKVHIQEEAVIRQSFGSVSTYWADTVMEQVDPAAKQFALLMW